MQNLCQHNLLIWLNLIEIMKFYVVKSFHWYVCQKLHFEQKVTKIDVSANRWRNMGWNLIFLLFEFLYYLIFSTDLSLKNLTKTIKSLLSYFITFIISTQYNNDTPSYVYFYFYLLNTVQKCDQFISQLLNIKLPRI